jgi:hypothetical protein
MRYPAQTIWWYFPISKIIIFVVENKIAKSYFVDAQYDDSTVLLDKARPVACTIKVI